MRPYVVRESGRVCFTGRNIEHLRINNGRRKGVISKRLSRSAYWRSFACYAMQKGRMA